MGALPNPVDQSFPLNRRFGTLAARGETGSVPSCNPKGQKSKRLGLISTTIATLPYYIRCLMLTLLKKLHILLITDRYVEYAYGNVGGGCEYTISFITGSS